MPGQTLMLIGLLVIAGCAPTAPQSAEPETVEPTVDIPATVAAVVAEQTGASPAPTPTAVVPTAAPTTTPAAAPAPSSSNDRSAPEAVPVQGAETVSADTAAATVHPSEVAQEITGGLLMSFIHSVPEYTDWVRGSFLYIEDRRFCEAGGRFNTLVVEAKSFDGERLISAGYNAGVAFMMAGWDDQTEGYSQNEHVCSMRSSTPPYRVAVSALNLAIEQLEAILPHLSDDRSIDGAHLMLGRAYANKSLKVDRFMSENPEDEVERFEQKAAEHLCEAVEHDSGFAEASQKVLTEIGRSCGGS